MLDLRALTDAQLSTTQDIFDDFRYPDLMPAYLGDVDSSRAHCERHVICDLLGFNDSAHESVRHLVAQWCVEPFVHGGNPSPTGEGLLISSVLCRESQENVSRLRLRLAGTEYRLCPVARRALLAHRQGEVMDYPEIDQRIWTCMKPTTTGRSWTVSRARR